MTNTMNHCTPQPGKRGARIPLPLWLGYLIIVALMVGLTTFALYTSVASGGSSATVAKFDVTVKPVDGQETTLTMMAGEAATKDYRIQMRNGSEVTVEYTVKVTNVPKNVEVTLGTETIKSTGLLDTLSFAKKTMAMGAAADLTLSFSAAQVTDGVDNHQVKIDVLVEQVD